MRTLMTIIFAVVAISQATPSYFNNTTSSSSNIPDIPIKRSYVCPPNFVRLSHRCYFFSREKASWQAAYFQCRDLRSNLAIIKTPNQDKLIRKTLSKRTVAPSERWIGGVYDWEQMQWKWAASGKPLTYQGFQKYEKDDKESLRWHCIIVDPALQYKWNTRSCIEEKHYICHTKLKIITNNKDKKKLLKQYKVNKLNEIPIPDIPGRTHELDPFYKRTNNFNTSVENLKSHHPISLKFEINNDLNAQFAEHPRPVVKKRKNKNKNGRKNKNKRLRQQYLASYSNGTVSNERTGDVNIDGTGLYEAPKVHTRYHGHVVEPSVVKLNDNFYRRRRNKVKEDELLKEQDTPIEKIKWKTYRKETNVANPLYPKPIVEEYNYVKES